ncbi:hypothetical protein [Actinomycetospora straminea]|uniref:Uncharacterized protein n=1 Tax=Actinomycetospora straminea TaxID=663607 RepID=A0ABP9EGM6_9PSEU|nr:hypothetical protein [Actinomycetospora straminea]MDD7933746.1 hypothetical protein [Actinomycetospora straminea]
MIELSFAGWFQCRLATDPDPYDEPRGVSGYVHAYAGEPDLDRIVSFQPPPFRRTHGRDIGVAVDAVAHEGIAVPDHPLVGATVDLLDAPKFEGRNGVVADDGLEPLYPFHLQVARDDFRAARAVVPADPSFPYAELFAGGVEFGAAEIRKATGEQDLTATWAARVTALRAELADAAEPLRTAIAERLAFLTGNLGADGGGAARFFGALMRYDYVLSSEPEIDDPHGWLDATDHDEPWRASFWLGGWDADVLCGYARGTLRLPDGAGPRRSPRVPRVTDRRP